jgi:hypothetical protein
MQIKNSVSTVKKITSRRKIITGVANCIDQTTVEKCGGAVERKIAML